MFLTPVIRGMGVVCVLEGRASARLQTLFDERKAVAIFEKHDKEPSHASVRAKDVLRLLNFLHFIGWRYRMHGIQPRQPQLVT
jgi:hypothetical protein